MKDVRAYLEKLRADADACLLISKLAASAEKRALFARLAAQLTATANEVEMNAKKLGNGDGSLADVQHHDDPTSADRGSRPNRIQ